MMRRPLLPESVLSATRRVSRAVWKMTYVEGEGPMHYAGGPSCRSEILMKADYWEALARDIREVAQYLPDGEDFYDTPAARLEQETAV